MTCSHLYFKKVTLEGNNTEAESSEWTAAVVRYAVTGLDDVAAVEVKYARLIWR